MARLSIQRNHDTDHLLGPYQAAVPVARVEGVGLGALHVVPGGMTVWRNRCQRTMVVGLQLATPTSSPLIATCRPATVTASPGRPLQ